MIYHHKSMFFTILSERLLHLFLKQRKMKSGMLTLPTAQAEGFCSRSDSHHPAMEPGTALQSEPSQRREKVGMHLIETLVLLPAGAVYCGTRAETLLSCQMYYLSILK
jgi:hypothetical protein